MLMYRVADTWRPPPEAVSVADANPTLAKAWLTIGELPDDGGSNLSGSRKVH
jgi:hypothetical protein